MEKSYTTKQVAEIMGVTMQTVRLWIADDVLQAFKVNNRWHVNESEIRRLQENHAND